MTQCRAGEAWRQTLEATTSSWLQLATVGYSISVAIADAWMRAAAATLNAAADEALPKNAPDLWSAMREPWIATTDPWRVWMRPSPVIRGVDPRMTASPATPGTRLV